MRVLSAIAVGPGEMHHGIPGKVRTSWNIFSRDRNVKDQRRQPEINIRKDGSKKGVIERKEERSGRERDGLFASGPRRGQLWPIDAR